MERLHIAAASVAAVAWVAASASAGVVFSDNFNRANVNTGTTLGSTAIGNGWTFHSDSSSPQRGGAQISNNVLQIGQPAAGGYAGTAGADRSWVWQDSNNWSPGYNPVLTNNTGLVTWTFNMRVGQFHPTPVFTSGGTTAVVVLALGVPGSSDWQFDGNADGYAVTYTGANATSTDADPLVLRRLDGGVRGGTQTDIITASVSPFSDLSNQYLSVKVTYNPDTDLWTLAAATNGGGFGDPATATYTDLGSVVDSTFTGQSLRYMGLFGNSNNGANGNLDDVRFDNVSIDVAIPEPSMLGLAGVGVLAMLRRQRRA